MKYTCRRKKVNQTKKKRRNRTRKYKGGNPTELTEENPIQIVGNKLYINLWNAYYNDYPPKQHYNGDYPVYIYNRLDFQVNKDGKMYITYSDDSQTDYGHIDTENKFRLGEDFKLIHRYFPSMHIDNTKSHTQLMSIPNVKVSPGNSNKKGKFEIYRYDFFYRRTYDGPITLEQNMEEKNKKKEELERTSLGMKNDADSKAEKAFLDVEQAKTTGQPQEEIHKLERIAATALENKKKKNVYYEEILESLKKIRKNPHLEAKYLIFYPKNMKLYHNYAFVRVVIPTGQRKAPYKGAYLEFENVDAPIEALRQEVESVVPYMPWDDEGAGPGEEYRKARDQFMARNISSEMSSSR